MPAADPVPEFVARLRGLPVDARWHPELGVVTFFDDEVFEGHDYDLVGPRDREAVRRVGRALGWRQRGARELVAPDGSVRLVLPRPAAVLGTSPLDAVRDLPGPGRVPLLTPTQALLLALETIDDPGSLRDVLRDVVREHPANLAKVSAWAPETRGGSAFVRWRSELSRVQAATVARRRSRRRG